MLAMTILLFGVIEKTRITFLIEPIRFMDVSFTERQFVLLSEQKKLLLRRTE